MRHRHGVANRGRCRAADVAQRSGEGVLLAGDLAADVSCRDRRGAIGKSGDIACDRSGAGDRRGTELPFHRLTDIEPGDRGRIPAIRIDTLRNQLHCVMHSMTYFTGFAQCMKVVGWWSWISAR